MNRQKSIRPYDVADGCIFRVRVGSGRGGSPCFLFVGSKAFRPATGQPYEGGIVSEGSAHVRFSVRYYLVAMFFVVFDLEAVFFFAWAVAARELGWAGYWRGLAIRRLTGRSPNLSLEGWRARLGAGAASFEEHRCSGR